MQDQILQVDENMLETRLDRLVSEKVEQLLNAMLDAEALIDMYLAGVSTRQVDDISRLLWGERMPSQTLSDKLKGVYTQIDEWRNRPLERLYFVKSVFRV